MLRIVALFLVTLVSTIAQEEGRLALTADYPGTMCDGPPSFVEVGHTASCAVGECTASTTGGSLMIIGSSQSSYHNEVANLFGSAPYIIRERYSDNTCSAFQSAKVFNPASKCVKNVDTRMFVVASHEINGSVSMKYFTEDSCSAEYIQSTIYVSKAIVEEHTCDSDGHKWYTAYNNKRALFEVFGGANSATLDDLAVPSSGTNDGTSSSQDIAATSTTSDMADTSTSSLDNTATSVEDTSTAREDATITISTTSSSKDTSSSTGGSSSTGSFTSEVDTDATEALDSTTTPSAASNNNVGTGSNFESDSKTSSGSSRSSSTERTSRVSITTSAPEVDTSSASSSATGSVQEKVVTDGSASGSDIPTTLATAKVNIGTGAIVGIVMGSLVIVVVVIGTVIRRRQSDDCAVQSPQPVVGCGRSSGPYWGQTSPINRQRRSQQRHSQQRYSDPRYSDSISSRQASFQRASSGQSGLWNDDIITAKRIPRDKVEVQQMLSRGAYGEVFLGVYNRKQVAVKMLLPQMRGEMQQVNEFLTEAKLTAMMEHPHIVSFVGVAWDSLSDVCVVLEYMDGGDLRSLLSNYEAAHHPVGFDREKVTIALHVCHALTYLHSLTPSVIHRDLKSRNVLLNQAMEAKVTDFGVSRERLDRTMTAGVGTSLWMAPEVMMGEKYDVKADIFSFGVVLSELDVHSLPYAEAMATARNSNQMACAVLMQKVAMGTLTVEFSRVGPRSMMELGCACVAVDPRMRPTAAEILYKLQTILARDLA